MTLQIATLIETIREASAQADEQSSADWASLLDALKPFEDFPLQSLTAKLRQVVLKKPVAKTPAKKKASAGSDGGTSAKPRAKKPKLSEADRQAALDAHVERLKSSFDSDDAFGQAFELAKSDAALDAKSALKLFERVIGPVNFPADPPRKPSIFKQVREQRNTIVYRRDRTGQMSESAE